MEAETRGTVLVVDDTADFVRAVSGILRREGFAVHSATLGSQAIAFLERRSPHDGAPRPDFVVLDYWLDDMTATTVLDRMARAATLRSIPVLVVTQTRWAEDEAKVLAAGATAFREKPSRVRPLRDVILTFWEEHVHGSDGSADRR